MAFDRNYKDQSSKKCFDDLKENGLIKPNYFTWKPKTIGIMHGFTLFGKTKTGLNKKVYVKAYSNTFSETELGDYAAFAILKKCGVRVPKVKLQATPNTTYMFSTDIAQKKKTLPEKNYRYFDKNELPYSINLADGTLRSYDDKTKIPIDKDSAIRIGIFVKILSLVDLNSSNLGFVISEKKGNKKAKIACVDFMLSDFRRKYMLSDGYTSLSGLTNSGLWEISFHIENLLTESDYINAFEKIEANFLTACEEVKINIKNMKFESDGCKNKIYNIIDDWIDNFKYAQRLAHKHDKTEKQISGVRMVR